MLKAIDKYPAFQTSTFCDAGVFRIKMSGFNKITAPCHTSRSLSYLVFPGSPCAFGKNDSILTGEIVVRGKRFEFVGLAGQLAKFEHHWECIWPNIEGGGSKEIFNQSEKPICCTPFVIHGKLVFLKLKSTVCIVVCRKELQHVLEQKGHINY